MKFWSQYLKSERMDECFDLYKDYQYKIPTLLSIATFIERNNLSGKDIADVSRTANDIINLNQYYSNLKAEIEKSEQIKKNMTFQNTRFRLLPMELLTRDPSWNRYY